MVLLFSVMVVVIVTLYGGGDDCGARVDIVMV